MKNEDGIGVSPVCKFCIHSCDVRVEDCAQQDTHDEACLLFTGARCPAARLALAYIRAAGGWQDNFCAEETALALGHVTAARILPPLTRLPCGSDLLAYEVALRAHLDDGLVDELRRVLHNVGRECGWEQVSTQTYLCVIGAGVAACLDMTPGAERLGLRYAADLQHELFLAGCTRDLPRSRLFLQTVLYEKFDLLLRWVRQRTWHWLYG